MKTLKFTTTKPYSVFGSSQEYRYDWDKNNSECTNTDVKGSKAYIHANAENIAGFDQPTFFDGALTQMDLPIEKQDIKMYIDDKIYDIKAVLQGDDEMDSDAYYLTLKRKVK